MRTVFDDEIDVSERGEVGDELTVLTQGSGEQPLEDVQADDRRPRHGERVPFRHRIIALIGVKSGAKSFRAAVPEAWADAAALTAFSVNTSPAATRLNDRIGGVKRTADCSEVVSAGPEIAVVVAVAASSVAATNSTTLDVPTRARRPVIWSPFEQTNP